MYNFIIRFLAIFLSKSKRKAFRNKHLIVKYDASKIGNNSFVLIKSNGDKTNITHIVGLNVIFMGQNSTVELHEPIPNFQNSRIEMGDNAKLVFNSSTRKVSDFIVYKMRPNSMVSVGTNFTCESCNIAMQCEDGLKVTIGDNCMFSHNILIRPTDSHAIIDLDTNMPLNYGGNITIGNHVWLCPNVMVRRGVSIANDCVVGAYSIVTKSITEEHTVNVGTPTRQIKKNVTWNYSSAQDYYHFHHQ